MSVASITALCAAGPVAAQTPARITVDLGHFGYTEKPVASNREFLAHATPDVLSALDGNTRLVSLSPGMLLVYAARPDEGERPWSTSVLHAFFFDAATQTVNRSQSWKTRPRLSPSEQQDSEGRIFPSKGGRYIVSAQDALSLFSSDGALLKRYQPPEGFHCSVSVTPDRSQVVIRNSASAGPVQYVWLNGETLSIEKQLSRSERGSGSAFSAVRDGLVLRGGAGFRHLSVEGTERSFCSDACRDTSPLAILSNGLERVAFLTNYGVGVASMDGRLLWSRSVAQDLGLGHMMFQAITASADGRKVAFTVLRGSGRNQNFDGVHLDKPQEILVFDSESGRRVLMVPARSVNGDEAFELSTDGKILWTFDGKTLRAFNVPD
jgi:hypothetical protein